MPPPQDPWLVPFSIGRRRCLGEAVARDTTFLMLAALLQRFRFTVDPEQPLPTLELVGGLTIGPQPFQATIQPRL